MGPLDPVILLQVVGIPIRSGFVLLAAVLTTTIGCAVQNVGFLAAEVTQADGANVVDVYALGAYLRTRADDPGLTLGWARRSYVLARSDEFRPKPGWYYFNVPLPTTRAVALDTRAIGLEIRAGAPEFSLTLGLRADTVIANVPRDESLVMRLSYAPANPGATRLTYCNEEKLCW